MKLQMPYICNLWIQLIKALSWSFAYCHHYMKWLLLLLRSFTLFLVVKQSRHILLLHINIINWFFFLGFVSLVRVGNYLRGWSTPSRCSSLLYWVSSYKVDEYGQTFLLDFLFPKSRSLWASVKKHHFQTTLLGETRKGYLWHIEYAEFWCHKEVPGWWGLVSNICKNCGITSKVLCYNLR